MTKSIKIITIKQKNMEVHNFGDRIHDITNEIVEALRNLLMRGEKTGFLIYRTAKTLNWRAGALRR